MESEMLVADWRYIMLYGGVMMLSLLGALYLLLRRGNAFAPEVSSPVRLRRWAAAFLLIMLLGHVWWLVYYIGPWYNQPLALALVAGLDSVILVPAMMATLLAMLQDRRRPVWPIIMVVLPVVSAMAVYAFFPEERVISLIRIYLIVLDVLFTVYMVYAVRQYSRWLRDNYSDLEHKEVWKSLLVLAVFLLVFLLYGASANSLLAQYVVQVNDILLVALLLWRVETLQQIEGPAGQEEELPQTPESETAALLEQRCEQERLYLQHDLTLSQLSAATGIGRNDLIMFFARQGKTYNAYINGLRIRHFIRLYQESVAAGRSATAKQLAFESGFHSYSTFGSVFKQSMGQPVSEWMRGLAK